MKRILLVEDEKSLSSLLREVFVREQFEIEHAENGELAIERIESGEQFDLIVTDLIMPQKTGWDLMEYLQENGNTIPVLVLTNLSSERSHNRAMTLGAKKLLVKSNASLKEIKDCAYLLL